MRGDQLGHRAQPLGRRKRRQPLTEPARRDRDRRGCGRTLVPLLSKEYGTTSTSLESVVKCEHKY
ncbi:hypothetical protein ABZ154_34240, partial [Streptomyces sp. NPDC006261]|uniref:hypothetical protein n=1 Tax=Streptomyces sp. NPDC006261 TaxID=3156739 RepID=UPI0033B7D361